MDSGWTFCPTRLPLPGRAALGGGCQFDGHVARALVDTRGAAERPRSVALDRGALVYEGPLDPQLIRRQLVVRLGVRDRRVQQLEDVARRGARRVVEDSPRLLDRPAPDVVHDETGLARRGANVPGARANYDPAVLAPRRRSSPASGRGLRRAAPPARGGCLRLGSLLFGSLIRSGLSLGLGLGGPFRGRTRRRRLLDRGLVLLEALDQLGLLAALRKSPRLQLLLQLLDGQRLPAALGRGRARAHRTLTLSLPAWPRKTRVGANSPSLWPTIDSETKTGTCLRPSWTAIVCPTISGKIVEARDQVFTICFWPDSFICSMRRSSRSSTHGPFFEERDMAYLFPFLPRRRPRTM